jgi:hypothetical protein
MKRAAYSYAHSGATLVCFAGMLALAMYGSAVGQETIDLKAVWPNPEMARQGYYLSGANGFTWRFRNQAGDFDVWTLLGAGAADTYVWFSPDSSVGASIVLAMNAWPGGTRHYEATVPFPRHVRLSALPLVVTGPVRSRVRLDAQSPTECLAGFTFAENHGCSMDEAFTLLLVLSIDGDRVRLDSTAGSGRPYERMWAGYVPYCEAPSVKAPGVIRYETNITTPPIATELCWKRGP